MTTVQAHTFCIMLGAFSRVSAPASLSHDPFIGLASDEAKFKLLQLIAHVLEEGKDFIVIAYICGSGRDITSNLGHPCRLDLGGQGNIDHLLCCHS